MFSQTVEYALRAMIDLARASPGGRTTEEIASTTQVPRAYLSKILQQLSRSGLVKSQRGIGGGIRLTKDPAEINILTVVNAVDPIRRIKVCPLGLREHGTTLCPLHRRLDDSLESMEKAFGATSLAELLTGVISPLCGTRIDAEPAAE